MKFDITELPDDICLAWDQQPKKRRKGCRTAVLEQIDVGEEISIREIQQAYFFLYKKKASYGNAHQIIADGLRKNMLKRVGVGIYLKTKA